MVARHAKQGIATAARGPAGRCNGTASRREAWQGGGKALPRKGQAQLGTAVHCAATALLSSAW